MSAQYHLVLPWMNQVWMLYQQAAMENYIKKQLELYLIRWQDLLQQSEVRQFSNSNTIVKLFIVMVTISTYEQVILCFCVERPFPICFFLPRNCASFIQIEAEVFIFNFYISKQLYFSGYYNELFKVRINKISREAYFKTLC